MTPEELDEARAKEADRLWGEAESRVGELSALQVAARLARENWTPPEPVDPDLLIAREAAAQHWEQVYGDKSEARRRRDGWCDAGQAVTVCRIAARMAREQERERAKVLVEYVEIDAVRLDGVGGRARKVLAKYRGEA